MATGTSIAFLTKRLTDIGRHDLLQAVQDGLISTYAAAVEAGLVMRQGVTGTGNKGPAQRRRLTLDALARKHGRDAELRPAEAQDLTLGPSPYLGSCFASRETMRAVWEAHRDGLLARANPGRRPQAYYEFDWPHGPRPPLDTERSTLWRLGLLTEAEREVLQREWREEFDRASEPDFAICKPWPEALLEGAKARREHLDWADVPHELRRRWTAARRRRVASAERKTRSKERKRRAKVKTFMSR
jgi:hypothetical protein